MNNNLLKYNKIKFEIDPEEAEILANEELYEFIHSGEPYNDFDELNPDEIVYIHFNDFGIEENDSFDFIVRIGATVFFKDQLKTPSHFLGRVSVGFNGMDIRSKGECKVKEFYRFEFEHY